MDRLHPNGRRIRHCVDPDLPRLRDLVSDMGIFQNLRARAEFKRMKAEADHLDNATRMWLAASRAMTIGCVMTMFWFFVKGHKDATSKGVHDLANRLSRLGDELEWKGR